MKDALSPLINSHTMMFDHLGPKLMSYLEWSIYNLFQLIDTLSSQMHCVDTTTISGTFFPFEHSHLDAEPPLNQLGLEIELFPFIMGEFEPLYFPICQYTHFYDYVSLPMGTIETLHIGFQYNGHASYPNIFFIDKEFLEAIDTLNSP
jgi:hypothetical protein